MTTTKQNKPDIVQSFDAYEDREYFKISRGFIFSSVDKIRADTIREWKEWRIECATMPDVIYVNGKEFSLIPL